MSALPSFVDRRVTIKVGDITREDVDTVVNAANSSLMGGGGVDGAIHRAGGPAILEACKAIRDSRYRDGLPTGEAVLTTAGRMSARHVIHTVGPVHGAPDGAHKLASCYRTSLRLAVEQGLTSVAFPAISTGVYGYPKAEAAAVASRAIEQSLCECPSIREVRLVFFDARDADVFLRHHVFGQVEDDTPPGGPVGETATYRYFAYGSNLSSGRLRARAPSAVSLGRARLPHHALRWHKLGRDGSGKCNIEFTGAESPDVVWGVLYRIDRRDKPGLDRAEGLGVGYDEDTVDIHTDWGCCRALTYKARPDKIDPALRPLAWYKAHVQEGASEHGLPEEYVERVAAVAVEDRAKG